MYCSQCGKKVDDAMLYCPFCGKAIVIPDQSDALPPEKPDMSPTPAQAGAPENDAPVESPSAESENEVSEHGNEQGDTLEAEAELLDWSRQRREMSDDPWAEREDPAGERFTPLRLEEEQGAPQGDWREAITRKKQQEGAPDRHPPETSRRDAEPVRLEGSAPSLELDVQVARPRGNRKRARNHANTLVPPKTMNPKDIFMDGRAPDYEEGPDAYDDVGRREFSDDAYAFEGDDENGFFMRHLRGIVGLALFLMLIVMFVIYAFSRAGQLTLAQVNLAWTIESYNQLGYESYQAGKYEQAGLHYEHALQRDPGNYGFASAAAMAYFEGGRTEKSAEMLKRCIQINPTLLEPYIYLLKLYPEAADRPWDVTQLLQQGYQQTGDTRLNVTG